MASSRDTRRTETPAPDCRPRTQADAADHTLAYEQGGATCSFQTGMTVVRDHLGTHEPRWPKPPPPQDWEAEPPDDPVLD